MMRFVVGDAAQALAQSPVYLCDRLALDLGHLEACVHRGRHGALCGRRRRAFEEGAFLVNERVVDLAFGAQHGLLGQADGLGREGRDALVQRVDEGTDLSRHQLRAF